MKKLNNAIDRFCILHPNFGIPNLMLYVVIGNIAIYLLSLFSSQAALLYDALSFSLQGLLRGQVWRLVTFVFIPDSDSFWLFVSCYFYYWIGSSLERQWGTAKFTCYYIGGMLLTVLGSSLVSIAAGTNYYIMGASYVNFAMFLAFAMLWPDAQVLLFFVIPVRIKYLAYIDAAFFAINIIVSLAAAQWAQAVIPVMALLNFVIFFWPELLRFLTLEQNRTKQAAHFHNAAANARRQAQQPNAGVRVCAVCGRSSLTNPELDFRYCSRCAGYHCFCSDHIFSHVHFTDEQP